jgi:predicted RNase H-like HicB family nuclease
MPRTKVADKQVSSGASRHFRVVFEPDGDGWHAYIPAVRGCRTWGRSLTEARRHIREALATCEDVFPDAARVARAAVFVEDVKLPARVRRELQRYARSRAQAEAQAAKLRGLTRAAAVELVKHLGVSLRDAGELLGLSQERVRQVMAA